MCLWTFLEILQASTPCTFRPICLHPHSNCLKVNVWFLQLFTSHTSSLDQGMMSRERLVCAYWTFHIASKINHWRMRWLFITFRIWRENNSQELNSWDPMDNLRFRKKESGSAAPISLLLSVLAVERLPVKAVCWASCLAELPQCQKRKKQLWIWNYFLQAISTGFLILLK